MRILTRSPGPGISYIVIGRSIYPAINNLADENPISGGFLCVLYSTSVIILSHFNGISYPWTSQNISRWYLQDVFNFLRFSHYYFLSGFNCNEQWTMNSEQHCSFSYSIQYSHRLGGFDLKLIPSFCSHIHRLNLQSEHRKKLALALLYPCSLLNV